jgi:uncharacterized membrane protein
MSDTTQSGLSDNAAGAIAYITIIPAIVFLVMEPYNRSPYVKFHAWQSLFLGIALFVFSFINIIPILGQLIFLVAFVVLFVVWIICIVKAVNGQKFMIPVIGPLAAKQAGA